MNVNERLICKEIVSNELLGGQFDRMATYKTDGTLRIEQTPEFKPGTGWIPGQTVVLQNWEEIVRLRDFLNSLEPLSVEQDMENIQRESAIA
ncbi:hypothetical protein I532_01655 [Brevibacillus borstelensis AK1]|jgi:hypothetical protein|uniref:Uncharacterized protein n=1 Tax=Brevibacillus borstelensis AK1 TaxID=1300222 RepID=M8E4R2_9BACL|nr:hypothetical protein [Brevibacillus borstelensis]EMT54271.1 hypothetical protein I532_01655 [Brevibacillus borstelensis AK1]